MKMASALVCKGRNIFVLYTYISLKSVEVLSWCLVLKLMVHLLLPL